MMTRAGVRNIGRNRATATRVADSEPLIPIAVATCLTIQTVDGPLHVSRLCSARSRDETET